jgi:hypothetical protein
LCDPFDLSGTYAYPLPPLLCAYGGIRTREELNHRFLI